MGQWVTYAVNDRVGVRGLEDYRGLSASIGRLDSLGLLSHDTCSTPDHEYWDQQSLPVADYVSERCGYSTAYAKLDRIRSILRIVRNRNDMSGHA